MNKRLAYISSILFLLSIIHLNVNAQNSIQVNFDEANKLLENNDAFNALKAYKSIENTGYESPELYLNMAISATQIDSLGLAKFYFLKIINNYPNNTEVANKAEEGLSYLESKFSRKSAILPKLPWNKAIDWIIKKPTPAGIFWFGYIALFIVCVLIITSWFKILNFKGLNKISIILAVISILSIALAYYASYTDLRYNDAVVINTETKVLQQPTESSAMESFAYEGYTLTIDNKMSINNNDWLYVRLSNGQAGWIKKEEIKIL